MRKDITSALRIGLSRTGAALTLVRGWMRRRAELVAETSLSDRDFASAAHLATRLGRFIADHQCSHLRVSVILADELVRLFMVTPPGNATRLQDYRSAADMRFQSLYGEALSDWRIEADWDTEQPFLACATPDFLLGAVRQVANEQHLTCIEIVPRTISAWNQWRNALIDGAWFGVAHGNQLTIGVIAAQRLSAVRTVTIPADAWDTPAWLPEHLGREALRLNVALPQQLQICGDVPGHWAEKAFGPVTCRRLDLAQRSQLGASVSGAAVLAFSGVEQ